MAVSTLSIAVAALAALGITALVTGHDGVAAAAAAGGILTIAGYAARGSNPAPSNPSA
jgi:hypothetical protein